MNAPVVVAIPARNEEASLAACLHALIHQSDTASFIIFVLVNNSTDASAGIARDLANQASRRLIVEDIALPADRANAGHARRIAMERAACLAGPHGVILTTDADGRVAPDWLAANLQGLVGGADAIAGRALIDPDDERGLPVALIEADAMECAYAELLDEIAAHIDPEPADPWPRHFDSSGASIAVTVAAFRRAGGMPSRPLGEDRAFFAALRRIDARIRHDPGVQVIVSGRREGRAKGGMADTIRRRLSRLDAYLDERLEPAGDAARRFTLRHSVRKLWHGLCLHEMDAVSRQLHLLTPQVQDCLCSPYFGTCWSRLEETSPVLRRSLVPASRVGWEIRKARCILAQKHDDRRRVRCFTAASETPHRCCQPSPAKRPASEIHWDRQ